MENKDINNKYIESFINADYCKLVLHKTEKDDHNIISVSPSEESKPSVCTIYNVFTEEHEKEYNEYVDVKSTEFCTFLNMISRHTKIKLHDVFEMVCDLQEAYIADRNEFGSVSSYVKEEQHPELSKYILKWYNDLLKNRLHLNDAAREKFDFVYSIFVNDIISAKHKYYHYEEHICICRELLLHRNTEK